jgi:N-acyl homoserine lactone hydrolase
MTWETGMAKFIIAPHMRLQEWVAESKGYFKDEGLDYEFRKELRSKDGKAHDLGGRAGARQRFEHGRKSDVSCACHWTVNVAAWPARTGVHMRTFLAFLLIAASCAAQAPKPAPPKSARVYIFDCGTIKAMNPATFGFKEGEVTAHDFFVPCYLIAHPKGTLMWDVGVIPDAQVKEGGTTQGISTVTRTLKSQLAEIGYTPADITYLAHSHYHSDHTANSNDFAGSTWLVHPAERDFMFSEKPQGIIQPAMFSALKNAKTKLLTEADYDVFGDGTVIIKYAPGHTPGHQVLFLKLKKTGPVLIAGDLYHLPEERTMHRFPTFEYNVEQSGKSRAAMDEFLKKTKAQMWIEHDMATNEKLTKSPGYYE